MKSNPQQKTIAAASTRSQAVSRTGFWLSALCTVHCLAMPVLAMFLPAITAFLHSHIWFEFGLLAGGFGIGVISVIRGYRLHGSVIPALIMIPALALVGMELAEIAGEMHFLLPVGAGLAAISQFINFRQSAAHHVHTAACRH